MGSTDEEDSSLTKLSSAVTALTCNIPKILRKDIRRSYADMFANVTNSSDIGLIEGFYKAFSVKSLEFEQRHVKPSMMIAPAGVVTTSITTCSPPDFKLESMPVFLQFWYNRMHLVPDGIMQVTDVKVVTRSDTEESQVRCEFLFSATRVFDVPYGTIIPSEEQQRFALSQLDTINNKEKKRKMSTKKVAKLKIQQRTDLLVRDAECEPSQSTTGGAQIFDTGVLDAIYACPLLEKPLSFEIRGEVTMFLDVNKYITKLLFHGREKKIMYKA